MIIVLNFIYIDLIIETTCYKSLIKNIDKIKHHDNFCLNYTHCLPLPAERGSRCLAFRGY